MKNLIRVLMMIFIVYGFSLANVASVELNGNNQYLGITDGNQVGLDITGSITIEARVKFKTIQSTNLLVTKWGSSGNRSWDFFYASNIEKLQLKVINSSDAEDSFLSDELTIDTGTWYHVAVTWDASASTAKFYLDGSPVGTPASQDNTDIKNTGSPVQIGYQNIYDTYFNGKFDEVRIWNDARTTEEISANYSIELAGSEANLQGYWKFNNNGVDETSNGNDLTAFGSSTYSSDIPIFIEEQETDNYVVIKKYPEYYDVFAYLRKGLPVTVDLIDHSADPDTTIRNMVYFEGDTSCVEKYMDINDYDDDGTYEISVMIEDGKTEIRDSLGILIKTIIPQGE